MGNDWTENAEQLAAFIKDGAAKAISFKTARGGMLVTAEGSSQKLALYVDFDSARELMNLFDPTGQLRRESSTPHGAKNSSSHDPDISLRRR